MGYPQIRFPDERALGMQLWHPFLHNHARHLLEYDRGCLADRSHYTYVDYADSTNEQKEASAKGSPAAALHILLRQGSALKYL